MDNKASLQQRILGFPLTKIVIGLVVCLGIGTLGWFAAKELLSTQSMQPASQDLVAGAILALLIAMSYKELFKRYERREITELSAKAATRNIFGGIGLGATLQLLVFLVMYLKKDLVVISVNRLLPVVPIMASIFVNAITAEILIIGIVFRITEEALGSYLSLVLLVVIFVLLHMGAPNTGIVGAFCVALHGGFLLGAAYIWSRSLWFVIAIHFAWDFMQAGFFGASVSGYIWPNALLSIKIEGSPLVVGGYLGPHSSLQAGLFCFLAGIGFLGLSRNKKIIKTYRRDLF